MPFSHSSEYAKLTLQQQASIGRFVTEWANAEFYLGVLLGRLLGTPEYLARTYTDFLGALQIQQAILQALDIHHHRYVDRLVQAELATEIRVLNSKIEKLRLLRNKFAHFCWARSSDEAMFGTPLSGAHPDTKRGSRSHLQIKVTELDAAHDELYQIVSRLEQIISVIPEVAEESYVATFREAKLGA